MIDVSNKNKAIIIDMIVNIMGTGIPLVILQLVIYPLVSRILNENSYGQMLSIMSVLYLISGTLGVSLSTTRLIKESIYKQENLLGDFNPLFIILFGLVAILSPTIISIYLISIDIFDLMLITIVSILLFTIGYIEVGFRITLNYKAIFFNKVLAGVGYLLGFFLFYITKKWEYIFILSYLLPILYCVFKSNIIREPRIFTKLYKKSIKSFSYLSLSMLFSKSLLYFDKLLIFPLMGGRAVSIYFAANVFGKLILVIIEPITNVMLAYLSRMQGVTMRVWKKTIIYGGIFSLFLYVGSIIISAPVLKILYPQWSPDAVKLVPIALLSAVVSSFINIVNTLVLKVMEMKIQVIVNAISLIIYICFSLILYPYKGLLGYCQALLYSYLIKLLILGFFFFRYQNEI